MRVLQVALVGATLFMAAPMRSIEGQQLPAPSPPWANQMPEPSQRAGDSQPTAQQVKSRLVDRQKRLVADTDRLQSLAADLKSQVANSSNTNTFPVDEIKKADEIEKLAHSVKQRLKD